MTFWSIQHISFSSSGGAGQVAKTLNENLIKLGHGYDFIHIATGDIKSIAFKHPTLFLSGFTDFFIVRRSLSQSLFSLYRNGSSLNTEDFQSQLIHLHWTPGMVSHLDMHNFSTLKLPVIWTIHDMFPFTGGCHHAMKCDGYKFDCSNCPQVRPLFKDQVSRSLTKKINTIQSTQPISVVTPSVWLGNKAKESQVFKNTKVTVIPNPIDTEVFTPKSQISNTPTKRFTIGCNATNLLDPMKGVLSILEILETFQISHPELDVELIAIGGGKLPASRVRIRQPGFISNQKQIIELYQDMDVFVSMSLAEVFGLSFAEAQSCGIPVICLNTGGMPEMIDHGVNGFVVDSPEYLLRQLNYFSNPSKEIDAMSAASRSKAVSQYSTNVVVRKYVDLYTQELAK